MSLSLRVLVMAITCLVGVNAMLAWLAWPFLTSTVASPMAASVASPVARPSTVTSECRTHINAYLAQSSARMNEYFRLYDEMTASNHLVLADEVMALSKDVALLPESCPATLDTALHMNYISVYSSHP